MNAVSPLKKSCDAAGYDYNKLPEGASDIKSNNDGTFTITVNGKPVKYNKDGSVFSNPADNNSGGTPANNAGGANGKSPIDNNGGNGNAGNNNDNNCIFQNNGGGGNGDQISITNFGGGYNIDPAIFMGSAMGFDASTQMASNVPYGLGAVFGQGAVAASLQNFMKSISFNFDFSQFIAQSEENARIREAWQSPIGEQGAAAPGDTEVTDKNGNKTTIAQLAKDGGYKESGVSGVYTKDGKSYKYDTTKKEFVECNADGTEITAESRAAAERAAKKKEAQDAAAAITEDLFDAMKGAGTKNDKLQSTVEKITKDNVIEVFEAWELNFADSMDNESLIESIQNEHYTGWFGNSQEKQENLIVDALYQRAMDLGLKNEAAACRAKVNSEHSAWFTSDETVRNAILTLVNQIKAKEAGVAYTPPQKTE